MSGPSTARSSHQVHVHIPCLDGYRAIAILLVLVCHCEDTVYAAWRALTGLASVPDLHPVGPFGVSVFFGISGFLITTRLIEEERSAGRISLVNFYLRRFFRIVPAAVTFLAVAGMLAVYGVIPISPDRWLSCLLMYANYTDAQPTWYVAHFWSLAVEEHFYLLWPLAFLLLALGTRRVAAVAAAIVAVAVWRAVAFKYDLGLSNPGVFWARTDIVADGLLCGVLAALLSAGKPDWYERLLRSLGGDLATLLLGSLTLAAALYDPDDWKEMMLLRSAIAMIVALMIAASIDGVQRGGRSLLDHPWLRVVGRYSYSLYLWQQLFCVWFVDRQPGLAPVQLFPASLLAASLLAVLSFHLIERPMIRLGQGFLARSFESRAPAGA